MFKQCGLSHPPHPGNNYCFRRIKVILCLFVYCSRFNHICVFQLSTQNSKLSSQNPLHQCPQNKPRHKGHAVYGFSRLLRQAEEPSWLKDKLRGFLQLFEQHSTEPALQSIDSPCPVILPGLKKNISEGTIALPPDPHLYKHIRNIHC